MELLELAENLRMQREALQEKHDLPKYDPKHYSFNLNLETETGGLVLQPIRISDKLLSLEEIVNIYENVGL